LSKRQSIETGGPRPGDLAEISGPWSKDPAQTGGPWPEHQDQNGGSWPEKLAQTGGSRPEDPPRTGEPWPEDPARTSGPWSEDPAQTRPWPEDVDPTSDLLDQIDQVFLRLDWTRRGSKGRRMHGWVWKGYHGRQDRPLSYRLGQHRPLSYQLGLSPSLRSHLIRKRYNIPLVSDESAGDSVAAEFVRPRLEIGTERERKLYTLFLRTKAS